MGGGVVGDVVLVPFPYADAEEEKHRPAVVLADAGQMGDRQDWILCQVTRRGRPGDIAVVRGDFDRGSLPRGSWARPNVLQTMSQNRFLKTYGHLSDAKLAELQAAARALFA